MLELPTRAGDVLTTKVLWYVRLEGGDYLLKKDDLITLKYDDVQAGVMVTFPISMAGKLLPAGSSEIKFVGDKSSITHTGNTMPNIEFVCVIEVVEFNSNFIVQGLYKISKGTDEQSGGWGGGQ